MGFLMTRQNNMSELTNEKLPIEILDRSDWAERGA